jgi:hypothetical protein
MKGKHMNKQIILLSLFLSTFAVINADICNKLTKSLDALDKQIATARKQNNSEQIQKLQAKRNKKNHQGSLCQDIQNAYHEAQKNSNYDQNLMNAYADLSNFAYAHFNDLPNNSQILNERLNIYEQGMHFSFEDKSRQENVNKARKILNKALKIENNSLPSEQKTAVESPEEMYIAVRNLCDNNKDLNDWSLKHFILETLAIGLKEECIIQHTHNGTNTSPCYTIPRTLNELFNNKDCFKN